jgi:hypothetical protein
LSKASRKGFHSACSISRAIRKEGNCSAHPLPTATTGGTTFKRHLAAPKTSITAPPPARPRTVTTVQDIDNLIARNFSEAMDYYHKLIAGSLSEEEAASIKVGAHKILIHLQVYPGSEGEVVQ